MKSIMTWLALFCSLSIACQENHRSSTRQPLSTHEALALAVSLANETCMRRFSVAPFDSSTFSIDSTGGRWQWGGLDLKGANGFSALVSFDRFGSDRTVDIFLTTDTLIPVTDPEPPPDE